MQLAFIVDYDEGDSARVYDDFAGFLFAVVNSYFFLDELEEPAVVNGLFGKADFRFDCHEHAPLMM